MARDVLAERDDIDRAIEGKTLCTVFADTCARNTGLDALRWKAPDGTTRSLTWSQYRDRVREITLGLIALGFAPGEFAVLMARNRPEHVIADLGVIHARGTAVSLYNTLAPEQVAYIAGHCDATVAFVEDSAFLEKFMKVRAELPSLRKVVLLEPSPDAESDWVVTLDELVELGRSQDPELFDRSWSQVTPDDLVTLIYTSGTTGPPKGVMNTHRNVMWSLESFNRTTPFREPGERLISYLPLAHAAERYASHWNGIWNGATVFFCPEVTQLLPHLVESRPQWFVAVPRVWEKLYAGLNAAIAGEPDDQRRTMIQGAVEVGRECVTYEQKGVPLPDDLAQKRAAVEPVFRAILQKVGLDEAAITLTGAAPISTEVIEFFHALGLRISEVWGMSELTAPATWNGIERIKVGTVGYALPGIEVALADDGEIITRGGNLMAGYYKAPDQTAETIDSEGWLHTGDVGTVDEDGYFSIVDRKKELIITAGGKNISPANLENSLKRHPLIGQAAVIGDRRAYLSALIVLDGEVAPAWARARGIESVTVADLAAHPDVAAEIAKAVEEVNQHVSRVEQIKRFTVLEEEWTAESDELTPTLKLKRRVINEKHAPTIDSMYGG